MADRDQRLRELGQVVADEIESGVHDTRLDDQRRQAQEQSVRAYASRARPPRQGMGLKIALAAAATVLVAIAGVLLLRQTPLPFGVDGRPFQTDQPRWVQAVEARVVPVRFADGSELELQAGGSARVIESTSRSVRVGLVHGRLRARIHHDRRRRWSVEAGPFQLAIVGTVFSVSWDAPRSRCSVEVERGKVRVSGPGLRESAITLTDGQSIRIDQGRAITEFAPRDAAVASMADALVVDGEVAVTRDAASDVGETGPRVEVPPAKRRQRSPAEHPDRWLVLYREARYAEAVSAARAMGIEKILKRGDAKELWGLGEAARYAREGRIATRTLSVLLRRFPRSREALLGTFLLGRVDLELNGRPAEAARWFRRYLDRSPRGPLAQEALGRLVDALARAGRREKAKLAARRYLARYPDGLFAEQARAQLESGDGR